MNITNTYTYSFSPTGTTEKFLKQISKELPNNEFKSVLTTSVTKEFGTGDLVLVGSPVFCGRIPTINLKNISNLKGNNTPAIAVVVYGNREYDDALLELVNTLTEQGFKVVSASAFTARHSMVTEIAKTRPNADDLTKASEFAHKSMAEIEDISDISSCSSVKVNGNFPYIKYGGVPVKPKANSNCNSCGKCVITCPANAIAKNAPNKTDTKLCITCMSCVSVCPQKARKLNPILVKLIGIALKKSTSKDKKPEFFI